RQLRRACDRVGELAEIAMHGLDPALFLRSLEEGARIEALGDRHPCLALPPLQDREVEALDRLVDEPALVARVENLADDTLRRIEAEVGDLAADLVDRPRRLGVDLLAGVLEPPLPLRLRLVLRTLDLRVGDLARV